MEKLLPALELYDHGNSSYRTNHDHKGPEKFHHSYPYIRSLCEESVNELGDGTFHGESTLTFDSAKIVITAARATPRLIAPYICLWRGHMISRSTYTGRKRMIFTIRGGRRKDIDRIRTRKYHRLCCRPGEMYSGTGHTIEPEVGGSELTAITTAQAMAPALCETSENRTDQRDTPEGRIKIKLTRGSTRRQLSHLWG